MIANVLQLTAGVLLAISSFVVKGFTVPIFGEKLTTFNSFKQVWLTRIGLILLVLGYLFPIVGWQLGFIVNISKVFRFLIGFGVTATLVIVFYKVAVKLARIDYERSPILDKDTRAPDGTLAFEIIEEKNDQKN